MRFLPMCAVAVLALLLSKEALAQRMPIPVPRQDISPPEQRGDIPRDKCLIELTLPSHAKVNIDDHDYGEQRRITLPTPRPTLTGDGMGQPCFSLIVDFPNGGRRSVVVEAKGGTVTRIALSAPPIEAVLLEGPGPFDHITSLAFSTDGKWIVMGTDACQAILWETSTGYIRWNGDVPISNAASDSVSVAFSPDGQQVLVGAEFAGIAVLDAVTGKRLRDIPGGDTREDDRYGSNAVAFSPDGRSILAALPWADQPVIAVWDAKSGGRLRTLRGPVAPADHIDHAFKNMAVSPDGRRVVAGAWGGSAVLFDVAAGKTVRHYRSNSGGIHSVAISHDGSKLLAGTAQSKAILWDISSGKQLHTFRCARDEYGHEVSSVAFSPDDRQALAGAGESTFLFDLSNGAALRIFDSSDDETYAVAFSLDGRHVLTAGSRDWRSHREIPFHEAVLWDSATGRRVQTFPTPKDAVRSLSFDAEGKQLTVGYEDDHAMAWDMNTGKPSGHLQIAAKQREETPQAASAERDNSSRSRAAPDEFKSLDGRWLVLAGENNTVVLRDGRTSKEDTILSYGMRPTIRVAFSEKTSRIAVADDDSVHIFNPETGKELATFMSVYGGRIGW